MYTEAKKILFTLNNLRSSKLIIFVCFEGMTYGSYLSRKTIPELSEIAEMSQWSFNLVTMYFHDRYFVKSCNFHHLIQSGWDRTYGILPRAAYDGDVPGCGIYHIECLFSMDVTIIIAYFDW